MDAPLKLCDDDGLPALEHAVSVLLMGVNPNVVGELPSAVTAQQHDGAWTTWLKQRRAPVKHAIAMTYGSVQDHQIEGVLKASRRLSVEAAISNDLTGAVLGSMDGAQHQRLLAKLHRAIAAGTPQTIPAAVAFAVKGALFNVSLVATQLAYFHHEWRVSGREVLGRRARSLADFLSVETHRQLLRIEWPAALDSDRSCSIFRHHG